MSIIHRSGSAETDRQNLVPSLLSTDFKFVAGLTSPNTFPNTLSLRLLLEVSTMPRSLVRTYELTSFDSLRSALLSECPRMTHGIPMLASCSALESRMES
jgi:hypothetical protein